MTDAVQVIGPVLSPRTFSEVCDIVSEARLGRSEYNDEYVRFYHHNLPPLVDLHRHLVGSASELFEVPLKASYVFLSLYLPGGTVPLHLDRPQCFRTIDLLVAQDDDVPWSICISDPVTDDDRERGLQLDPTGDMRDNIIDSHRWTEVTVEPNEAVCYSGTHSWHYRPKPATARTDLIFFHFAPEDYDGPLG